MSAPRPRRVTGSPLSKIDAIMKAGRQRAQSDSRLPFVALLLPVAIMFLVGILFGGNHPAPIGVVSDGSGALGADLVHMLDGSSAIVVRTYHDEGSLRDNVLRGRIVAGLYIPPGFDADVRAGRHPQVRLIAPVGNQAATTARVAAIQSVDVLASEWQAAEALAAARHIPVSQAFQGAQAGVNRFAKALAGTSATGQMSPYSYTTPSNIVLFGFLTLMGASSAIVETRRLGLFSRMLVSPTPAWAIVAGHMAGNFLLAIGQAIGLIAMGILLFGVHFGDPLGLALLVVALALAASGAGTLLGTLARSPEQAIAIGTVAGLALGMMGGCMYPLDEVSATVRAVGHVTPQAWAMDAFVKLIFGHDTLAGVLPDIAMLGVFALVLTGIATVLFRRMVAVR